MGHAFQQTIMDTMIRYCQRNIKASLWNRRRYRRDPGKVAGYEEGKGPSRYDAAMIYRQNLAVGGAIYPSGCAASRQCDWETRERNSPWTESFNAVKSLCSPAGSDLPWQTCSGPAAPHLTWSLRNGTSAIRAAEPGQVIFDHALPPVRNRNRR